MNFIWTAELECIDIGELINVATKMHWRCTGINNGNDLAHAGLKVLSGYSEDNFIPAPEGITSDTIRLWMGEEADSIEESIWQELLNIEISPTISIIAVPLE